MSDNRISVGIAGLGRSGWGIHQLHMDTLKDKYRIVAVYDPDATRRQEAHAKHGCAMYATYADMLKDPNVELIVNATPNNLHGEYSVMAMKAGKHVLCEKPMATCLDEADGMIEVSKKTGKILAPFQNRRYGYDFVKLREVIDSGKLGRIVKVNISAQSFGRRWDWQTLKKNNGGSMNNTGPHPVDMGLVLFGPTQPKVFCLRDVTLTCGDADDHVQIVLYGEGAPTIEIEITSACAYPRDLWLVMGTQGGLIGTATDLRWKYFDPAKLPPRAVDEAPTANRGYNSETIDFIEESWKQPDNPPAYSLGFYRDLYDTFRNGKPLSVTPEIVRRQMWVFEECRKQAPV